RELRERVVQRPGGAGRAGSSSEWVAGGAIGGGLLLPLLQEQPERGVRLHALLEDVGPGAEVAPEVILHRLPVSVLACPGAASRLLVREPSLDPPGDRRFLLGELLFAGFFAHQSRRVAGTVRKSGERGFRMLELESQAAAGTIDASGMPLARAVAGSRLRSQRRLRRSV